jgi:hypothetical protein
LHRLECKLALSLAEQIEKIGKARNDVPVQLRGRRASGHTRLHLGEFVAARALLERCHSLGDPAHRATGGGLSDDPYATMLGYLGVTLVYLGYVDQATMCGGPRATYAEPSVVRVMRDLKADPWHHQAKLKDTSRGLRVGLRRWRNGFAVASVIWWH